MNDFYKNIIQEIPEIVPFLNDMKNTMQSKIYHGEGDVLTHSLMVLDEVEKLEISETEKNILRYVSVLHDIGKPKTTKIIDNEIHSYNHSKVGYFISLYLLDKTNLDFDTKREILFLIKNHIKPVHLIKKENIEYEIIKLSLQCNLKLLYLFSICDNMGRISSNIKETLYDIEFLKLYAEQLNCFDKPFEFKSNVCKFNYLVKKSHHYLDEPYNNGSIVHFMIGLPGTGKDYFIQKNLKNLPVISLDEIRKELKIKPEKNQGKVIQLAIERAKEFLRKKESFVWNSTNTIKDTRDKLISMFIKYDAYIKYYYIHNNLEQILKQNKNRLNVVPENVIVKLFKKIEIPTTDECHELFIQKN